MKTNIDKDTYMPPLVMALVCILQLYHGTSLVKIRFLQAEAPRSRQNAVSFDVVKEKFNLSFGPLATGLLKTFGCADGDGIIWGSR